MPTITGGCGRTWQGCAITEPLRGHDCTWSRLLYGVRQAGDPVATPVPGCRGPDRAKPGSRRSCPGWTPRLLNIDRFRQPCMLPWRTPLAATETRLAVGQGQVRTVVPVPRGEHLPLRAARSSLHISASYCRYQATPTRWYHSSACAIPRAKVLARTQVRDPRGSAAACVDLPWEPHPPGDPLHDDFREH